MPTLVLYSKRDCHLCEQAKDALRPICERYRLSLTEVDITHNAGLLARYGEEVPVGFLNGEKVFKYRVEPGRLKRLIKEAVERAQNIPSGDD
ncbi:MAG: glutaredoxin family protein [Nitrospinota bacterium]